MCCNYRELYIDLPSEEVGCKLYELARALCLYMSTDVGKRDPNIPPLHEDIQRMARLAVTHCPPSKYCIYACI